jgi:uncharacterized protein YlxW (UPF0749 family)
MTLAVPLSILALWPLAVVLAGRQTTVDITIAIGVSITLAITTAFTGGLAYQQTKRANTARKRVDKLTADLDIANADKLAIEQRVEDLTADLTALRRDRELSGRAGRR